MSKSKWIETEKESDLINGQWVDKKRKMIRHTGIKPRTKEIWDIIFKFFAAVAIFSPFLIITLQNRSQAIRERKSNLSIVYAGILTDMRIYQNAFSLGDTTNQRDVLNHLSAEYPAKLALYGSNKITAIYDTVIRALALWETITNFKDAWESVQDETDLLHNRSDYVIRDSIIVMSVKTYMKNTEAANLDIRGQFTAIDKAKRICIDMIDAVARLNSKDFKTMQDALNKTLKFIQQLDAQNTLVFDAFNNDSHVASDEITISYMKDYYRIATETKAYNNYLLLINDFLNQKKSEMQELFRKEFQ